MILTLHHPRAIDVDGEWAIEIVASSDDEHDYLVLKESVLSQIEELWAKRKAEPAQIREWDNRRLAALGKPYRYDDAGMRIPAGDD